MRHVLTAAAVACALLPVTAFAQQRFNVPTYPGAPTVVYGPPTVIVLPQGTPNYPVHPNSYPMPQQYYYVPPYDQRQQDYYERCRRQLRDERIAQTFELLGAGYRLWTSDNNNGYAPYGYGGGYYPTNYNYRSYQGFC